MNRTRYAIAVAFTSALMVVSAAPAGAQPVQEGLVNVYADNTTVQIPIAVAANVCGVAVNLLANPAFQDEVVCTAEGVSIAQDEGGSGQRPRQSGLINVALVDTTVQVPVTVAANICGVAVNVLAQNVVQGAVDCEAIAESEAQN
jgi:hypothetical protein